MTLFFLRVLFIAALILLDLLELQETKVSLKEHDKLLSALIPVILELSLIDLEHSVKSLLEFIESSGQRIILLLTSLGVILEVLDLFDGCRVHKSKVLEQKRLIEELKLNHVLELLLDLSDERLRDVRLLVSNTLALVWLLIHDAS